MNQNTYGSEIMQSFSIILIIIEKSENYLILCIDYAIVMRSVCIKCYVNMSRYILSVAPMLRLI